MRSRLPSRLPRLVAPLLVAGLVLGACDTVGELAEETQTAIESGVDAAREAADLVGFCTAAARVAKAISDEDLDAAVDAGEDMVGEAPSEIRPEAELVLDGAKRAQAGDPSAVQTDEFEQAADAVQAFTRDRCDPR